MNKKDARDPYATICLSRLTRILDLKMLEDIQELEDSGNVAKNLELERHFKPHRSFLEKSTEKFSKIIHRKSHHHIFGHPLTDEAVQRILPLIAYLKTCVDKEGLFRISGNKKRQEELKEVIDKGDNPKLQHGKFTAHDVASVLKQFLGELPEPLLTHAPHKAYMQVTEINNDHNNLKHIEALQLLFLMIPPENRALLHNLLELLEMVSENQNNKMTAHNLAVVFCPNILYYIRMKVTCISNFPQDMDVMNEAVAFMVSHGKELFKIPEDLKGELKLIEKNISIGKEDEVPMAHTYCQQTGDNRQQVQQATSEALVELYNHVKDMPDGPTKQRFMEKFEKTHPGTPPFMPKSRARTKTDIKPSQLTYSTPIRSICTPGSLARQPLSPINFQDSTVMDPSRDLTGPMKAVTFLSPEAPKLQHKTVHHRGAPYKSIRTPSGLLSPFKSPHKTTNVFAVTRRKRTLSEGSPSPFRRRRTRTTHAPSVQPLSIQTPSGRLVYSPDPYGTPGLAVRKMYGSPAPKKRIGARADYQKVEETFV